jgi:RNA polymerase sigma factor (sigma-70 family)
MAASQMTMVIQHLRRVLPDGAGLTDEQLLVDYISSRDEAALAALVRRHGPMVWGVCSRVLRNHHDAEDAFQATFLVLVRRAASIASRGLLANWLYGVAHQTALKARATAAKRKGRERQVTEMPEPVVTQRDQLRDLQPVLDEELSRLPDHYRSVIVLCDLEGKTRKEIAVQLGCPEGTVASRLVRARTMLAKRLTNRGVPLSAGALAALLLQSVTSAGMPDSVVSSTITAAGFFATRQVAATGPVSVKVAALAEGVLKAMMISKLKATVAVVLVLGFMVTGATVLTYRTAAAQADQPHFAVEQPALPQKQAQEREMEGFTAWGKEVGGLQAGLGFRSGENRAYHYGETITLVIQVRNVSMKEVTFQYWPESDWTHLPDVTDAKGKPIAIKRGLMAPNISTKKVNLAPGKSIELWQWKLNLRPESESTKPPPPDDPPYATLYGPGKFVIQYPWVSSVSKLCTGKLEIEVKSDPPQKQEQKQEKDGGTAWGKEVGGLHAGLGYLPGQKRAYSHGETAKVVLRVRNVGKEAVDFKYIWAFFVENPPKITDADGKLVQLPNYRTRDKGLHMPRSTNVAPGKEVELYEWTFDLQPEGENSHARRVAVAIRWLRDNLARPLSIEALAREVHLSPSGLHHQFKAVTAMSPLQYQKRLRLQEARRLMLSEGLDAASAGFRVGYESSSQFSREYRRLFGQPPQRDLDLLRTACQPVQGERRAVS